MSKKNGFLAVRVMLALGVCAAFILWAAGQHTGTPPRQISGPEDLRLELWRAQSQVLPDDRFPVFFDAGEFVLTGNTEGAFRLAEGLLPIAGVDGIARWPVTLFEDALTRETVILDAGGGEFARLAPPLGYDPAWLLETAFLDGAAVPEWAGVDAYDPARVVVTARLLPGRSGIPGTAASGSLMDASSITAAVPEPAGAAPGWIAADAASPAVDVSPVPVAGSRDIAGQFVSAATNGASAVPGFISPPAARAIYVSARKESGALAGKSADGAPNDDPGQTLRAGMDALRSGGRRLVVMEGTYGEGINVQGMKADVRIRGDVVLTRPRAVPAPAHTPLREAGDVPAPTGTVARVELSENRLETSESGRKTP